MANKMNALLVDDEPEICLLLSNVLRREGADCVVAHTLAEGREALAKGRFDMVFLDVHLPDGLGYELVPTIKSVLPQAFSIVISAMDTESERALGAGADLFITKPFDRSTILSSIRHLGISL
jgi:DNA-binding response OmpR family regulator